MNYYALIYDLAGDYLERRGAFRDAHLSLARGARMRGELLYAGAFADPADKALLVFKTADTTAIEQFVRTDPYVINKLVTGWKIRPWSVVIEP